MVFGPLSITTLESKQQGNSLSTHCVKLCATQC